MRTLFEELVTGGASSVRGLVGREENLEFDCKLKFDRINGVPSKSDKETLAKAASAFANSMGGLLLWGVDARTNRTTKLDQIVNFEPIAEIARFKSEMARLAVEALMPRHAGILVEAIPETFPNETSGYLAMYVERSERRPHRCEFGDKYYYRRAGSTSRSMEHFEIEDAFRRFAVPQLSLDYVPIYTGQSADAYRGTVTISLELTSTNISRVSARFPYVAVKLIRPLLPDPHRAAPGVLPSRRDDWQYFEGGADIVIHPGVSRRMGSVRFDVPFSIVGPKKHISQGDLPQTLHVGFGCYNSQWQEEELLLSHDRLIAGIVGAVIV